MNARVPAIEITGLYGTMVKKFSIRQLGRVPESLGVMWNNRQVLKDMYDFGGKAQKWDTCELQLKSLAHMVTVYTVGCSFCVDFGYMEAHKANLDLDKACEVPHWRESTVYTPLERDVLEYAEAMSQTPPTVTDAMSAKLLDQLGAPALVEITVYIALANLMSRANVALGIESEGFAASAGLRPMAEPSAQRVVPTAA